jgi:hypothetical protein
MMLTGKTEVLREKPAPLPFLILFLILKFILETWDWGHGLNGYDSGQGQVSGFCECGNELSGSIKCREFSDWLRNCQLLRKHCVTQSE